MGVRGLYTLVNDNQKEFLSDFKLSNTKLIIDGSNLFHFLYTYYKVPTEYGGDYDHYAWSCKTFFNTLRICNVEPYVLLDGGYNPDDRKLQTVLERQVRRQKRAGAVCDKGPTGAEDPVLPVLAKETFRHVLTELGVPHVACVYEADREIAILANRWVCPVLSDDSDFFIYCLDGGYIPLKYIDMPRWSYNTHIHPDASVYDIGDMPTQNVSNYIHVKYYHHSRFADRFRKGKPEFILPIFAALKGNDYLEQNALKQFHDWICRTYRDKDFNLNTGALMSRLLYWLNTIESEIDALDTVIDHIPADKKRYVRDMLKRSIDDYRCIRECSSPMLDALEERLIGTTTSDATPTYMLPDVLDFNHTALPEWFSERLRSCEIGSFLQNVVVKHRVILNCQIENLKELSSYACSKNIRSVVYGILMNTDMPQTIEEHDRNTRGIAKVFVNEPMQKIAFGSMTCMVPTLCEVPSMKETDIQHITFASLGFTLEELGNPVVDRCALFLQGVLRLWFRGGKPEISGCHVSAAIICMFTLHVRALRARRSSEQTGRSGLTAGHLVLVPSVVQAVESMAESQINHFLKMMEVHLKPPDQSTWGSNEKRIIHGFSQFQACYRDAMHLNQALLNHVDLPSPSVLINCTLMFNVCKEIEKVRKVRTYFKDIFFKGSPMQCLFDSWGETACTDYSK